jgi:DNA-binding CsgD family transcriptional regulator
MSDSESPARIALERRRAARRETGQPPEIDPALEAGLRDAEEKRDLNALAEVVVTAGSRFEAVGRLEDALAELDYAAIRVASDPDARSIILGTKASFALGLGDSALARASISLAQACTPTHEVARRYLAANQSIVAAQLLEPDAIEQCESALQLTDSGEADHLHTFVLTWLLSLVFASGELRRAAPWERSLEHYAKQWVHPHRLADAAVCTLARTRIEHPEREWSGVSVPLMPTNWLARLRVAALSLHDSTFNRKWASASIALGNLSEIRSKHHPRVTENIALYRAVIDIARGRTLEFTEEPPAEVNLLTLGAVLAGAEAAAKAATPSLATSWLRALEGLPEWVESSLEWPVSRRRIEGLLLVRTGAIRDGIARLRTAVEWADRAGYPAERALAKLQLGTLLALADNRSRERQWRPIREDGWNSLLALNVDPAPHAYDASRTLELAGERNTPPLLSPREIEALKLLDLGLTYKEAAIEMGVGWRTVQTLAHRAYGKLDVSGKHAAIQVARERGLM